MGRGLRDGAEHQRCNGRGGHPARLRGDLAGEAALAEVPRNGWALCLGPHKGAILRNHGLLTVGRSVEEAVWWFISMERWCQAQILAESVGTPLQVDMANARAARGVNGSEFAGWFQCQPLWDRVVREEPDLLH